jgi:hypothetical protein
MNKYLRKILLKKLKIKKSNYQIININIIKILFIMSEKKIIIFDPVDAQQRIDREIKRLRDDGHMCVIELQSYPSQIEWCQNKDKCLANEAKQYHQNGHPCAYYSYGETKLCNEDPCVKLSFDKIKISSHPCAILPYHSFQIFTCNQEPCITRSLDVIHKTHPCAIVEDCILKQCRSNPCLGYKVKQMHSDGHTCASVCYKENQIKWCENYKKCYQFVPIKLFGNLKYLPYPKRMKFFCC